MFAIQFGSAWLYFERGNGVGVLVQLTEHFPQVARRSPDGSRDLESGHALLILIGREPRLHSRSIYMLCLYRQQVHRKALHSPSPLWSVTHRGSD